MPKATAYAPDGEVIVYFTRDRAARAVQSCKTFQINSKRVAEDTFERVYTYPDGTRIECDGASEVWNAAAETWGPYVPPPEPVPEAPPEPVRSRARKPDTETA